MPHPTIHPAIFEFLKTINEKNTREYFKSIRPLYDDILYNIHEFGQALINKLSKQDNKLVGLEIKKCMFRIYRDARRLKEGDQIYKNCFSFFIAPEGKKDRQAGYYIHLEPGKSFFGGGIYWPDPLQLMKIRKKIIEQGDEYVKLTQDSKFLSRFKKIQGKKTRKMPRGYTDDIPHAGLVKRKQHIITHDYTDRSILSKNFLTTVYQDCMTAKPWFDRLNELD